MKLPERVRQIIEATGLSAVVVSLLLVAYQIRQANQIAQATTTYEIVRDINQFNDMGITDPVFADLLVQLGKEDFAPSETQTRQAQLLAYRFLNAWVTQEIAFRNGLFTEGQFSLTKNDVVTVMDDYPALLPYWRAAMRNQPEFANYDAMQPLVERSVE